MWRRESRVPCARWCRHYLIAGMASDLVPRGMIGLSTPDSEKVLEEIADAYVNMDLATMAVFQKKVIAQMMPHASYEDALLQSFGGGGGGAVAAAASTAAAPGAAAAADADKAAAAAPAKRAAAEKHAFDISLKKYPAENKIKLIKELRGVVSLPIQEAKAAIEKCPGIIAKNVQKADAEKLQQVMQKLGAEVELV
ncbi:ribosomal protein L7/L12-like protein [Strigomonas culicis]|uniref:Ribosomal protein L7/L12-like protein n=1 Tax=Strigomonas culicis TaxID=28005 RepID=S9U8S9_9TRYP|nr:ribosomal protein L7/L12-like protein [Strigomonas culicis]|eukprot:EPY27132.1 ribosomal protein L7/L12-like protein [Strigomonas culicis]